MRLIDADKLKKTIIETLECIRKNPEMSRDEMHIIAAFATVAQMIDDMPTVSEDDELRKRQWISVKDRLPEVGQFVLITNGTFVCESFLALNRKWQRGGVDLFFMTATHWQPLPEPPKEG